MTTLESLLLFCVHERDEAETELAHVDSLYTGGVLTGKTIAFGAVCLQIEQLMKEEEKATDLALKAKDLEKALREDRERDEIK